MILCNTVPVTHVHVLPVDPTASPRVQAVPQYREDEFLNQDRGIHRLREVTFLLLDASQSKTPPFAVGRCPATGQVVLETSPAGVRLIDCLATDLRQLLRLFPSARFNWAFELFLPFWYEHRLDPALLTAASAEPLNALYAQLVERTQDPGFLAWLEFPYDETAEASGTIYERVWPLEQAVPNLAAVLLDLCYSPGYLGTTDLDSRTVAVALSEAVQALAASLQKDHPHCLGYFWTLSHSAMQSSYRYRLALLAERRDIKALGREVRKRWIEDFSKGKGKFTSIGSAPERGDYNSLLGPWKTFCAPPTAAIKLAETFAAFPCRYVHLSPKVPDGVELYGGNFVRLDAYQLPEDGLGKGGPV